MCWIIASENIKLFFIHMDKVVVDESLKSLYYKRITLGLNVCFIQINTKDHCENI